MESERSRLGGVAFVSVLLIITLLPSFAQTPDLHKITETVDRHYNALKSMQTDFTEVFRGGGLSRTETGTMYLKKPGKMRWDYKTPQRKLFVTDGKTAWFYVPGERQARRTGIKNLEDLRSPLRYLLGKTKLEKEFDGLILTAVPASAPGNFVLRGIPKGMEDRVQESRLEVTPDGRIIRISVDELDGTYTEFRFQNERDNAHVNDSLFKFAPPPGVEVMQATELQP